MKVKICIAFILVLIVIGTLCGCETTAKGMEVSGIEGESQVYYFRADRLRTAE